MKKLLFILLIIAVYLNLTYAYFYQFIREHHLASPTHETKIIVGNSPKAQTIKYVSLGDSLTEGVGASAYQKTYPYLLARKLSSKNNVELINLSRAGDTSEDVLVNQLSQALLAKPDLVTLLIGVNDIHNLKSLKEFENNLSQIASSLKNSGARIYILSVPYLGSPKIVYFPYNFLLDLRTKQFNTVVKKVATDIKAEYIDLYSLSKSVGFYSSDQLHPSDFGYEEWSKSINVN